MRLIRSTLILLLFTFATFAQERSQSINTDNYTSVGGGFSIKLPGDPQERVSKSAQQIDTVLTWGLKEGFVRIVSSRRLDAVSVDTPSDRANFVKETRQLIAGEPGLEVGEKGDSVKFGRFLGEKFPIGVQGLRGYLTILVVGKQSYMIMFISRPEIPDHLAKLTEAIATFTPAR